MVDLYHQDTEKFPDGMKCIFLGTNTSWIILKSEFSPVLSIAKKQKKKKAQ